MSGQLRWWQQSVIYQVLVPSYLDTNDDGVGDLPGVLQRMEYIHWLGAGAVWLSPIYPSPMADLGYDVADYLAVNPQFGTLDDFDGIVSEAHRRGMKIILDWVPNHTSDQHPWFQESRLSRDNMRRDWYLWHDPAADGSRPNNWISVFGGSVWTLEETTRQYYCHTFLDSQPDLNWRNPQVREALYDAMRWWLERGVDGFRIDAAGLMIKDAEFRDNPPNPNFNSDGDGPDAALLPDYTRSQPELHDVLAEMRSVVDGYDDRMLAGEFYLPVEKLVTYYGGQRPSLHLPLNLTLSWLHWQPQAIAAHLREYLDGLPEHGWPTWTISTHDCLRIAWRLEGEQKRLAAMLLMTLKGTPTLYYGEEVGMKGVGIPADRANDPQGRRTGRNRDPERTPMQWNGGENAGFSEATPWLPVGDDRSTANTLDQSKDERSLLTLYRRLMRLRNEEPALGDGALDVLHADDSLLVFERRGHDNCLCVVLNFGRGATSYESPNGRQMSVLLSSYLDRQETTGERVSLRPHEGLLLRIGAMQAGT